MIRYALAVDIGASSGRHILGHYENGEIVMEEIYRFPNQMIRKNGHLCWDIEPLTGHVIAGMKKCSEIGKIPATVGIDTWGVDYLLLDEAGNILGDSVAYRDERTDGIVEKLWQEMPFAEMFARTGIAHQPFNTVYQLLDDLKSGRMAKAKSLLMLPDYFHFRLTGVKKQEYCNATTTGMVNAVTHTWDEEIIETLGYKKELFGELAQPG